MTILTRKPTRIPGYDYSTQNYYFLTICTHKKRCIFGAPERKNTFGVIAEECIHKIPQIFPNVNVDKYVVMPNHVHMIMIIDANGKDVCTVIGQYKAAVTKRIRQTNSNMIVWQRSFHDHIIRNQKSYEKIWEYIQNNPLKWNEDCFYCDEYSVGEGQ